jgi:hypothetical protein
MGDIQPKSSDFGGIEGVTGAGTKLKGRSWDSGRGWDCNQLNFQRDNISCFYLILI